MDELIKQVTERTGLSEDKARVAVDTVLGFLQDRLPEPIAGQIANVISGGAISDVAGGVVGNIGGIFRGTKE